MMDEEEWLKRCAARYIDRAGMDPVSARAWADISLQGLFDTTPEVVSPDKMPGFLDDNSPEDEADADMDCWTTDE
jgi:hypothetical protein